MPTFLVRLSVRHRYWLLAYAGILLVLAVGFWWFRFVWLTKYSTHAYVSTAASFSASRLAPQLRFDNPPGKVMLVHFIDPTCPCTRYSLPFIEQLQARYADYVSHIEINADSYLSAATLPAIDKLVDVLPASPSVAIWNSKGELSYFGSYTTGTFCGEGEDLVAYVMEAIERDSEFQWLNQEALGCMCKWPTSAS